MKPDIETEINISSEIMALTNDNLTQLLRQIRQVPQFSGEPTSLSPFIRRIEYLLKLYPTDDPRQKAVIFGAIELQIIGDAEKVSQLGFYNEWTTLRDALISEFKTQTPLEELLQRLYSTPYKGNLRLFCEELEDKSSIIINKLALEGDQNNITVYTQAMVTTIKNTIQRKLPDRLFMTLARHDISTVQKLRQVSQQEGLYEDPISGRDKKSDSRPKLGVNSLNSPTNNKTNIDFNKNTHPNQQFSRPFNSIKFPTQTQNVNVNSNQTPYQRSTQTRQQQFDHNRQLYNEFREDLNRDRQNDTRNYSQPPQQQRVPTKRFKEGSGQSRMQVDESHQQYESDNDDDTEQYDKQNGQFHEDQLQHTETEMQLDSQCQQAENFPIVAWEHTNT